MGVPASKPQTTPVDEFLFIFQPVRWGTVGSNGALAFEDAKNGPKWVKTGWKKAGQTLGQKS